MIDTKKHAARLAELRKRRPKPGEYTTFTSKRGSVVFPFRKPVYTKDARGHNGVHNSDSVKMIVQRGQEFDAWTVCIGSVDGKVRPAEAFFKLVTEGYKEDGKTVILQPEQVQEYLETKLLEGKVISWADRERSEEEKRLEGIVKEHQTKLEARDGVIAKLVEAAKGKVPNADLDKILAGVRAA